MYPDLVSGACLPSLMESASRHLINAASLMLVLHIRFLPTTV